MGSTIRTRPIAQFLLIGFLGVLSAVLFASELTTIDSKLAGGIARGAVGVVLLLGSVLAAAERGILTRRAFVELVLNAEHRIDVLAGVVGFSLVLGELSRVGIALPAEVYAVGDLSIIFVVGLFGVQTILISLSGSRSVSTA